MRTESDDEHRHNISNCSDTYTISAAGDTDTISAAGDTDTITIAGGTVSISAAEQHEMTMVAHSAAERAAMSVDLMESGGDGNGVIL